jgi:hypothetical protein
MAYVERINRTPRQRNRMIDASVRAAVATTKAVLEANAQERGALMAQARAAVNALPASWFEGQAAKYASSSDAIRRAMLDAAAVRPQLTIEACARTMARHPN